MCVSRRTLYIVGSLMQPLSSCIETLALMQQFCPKAVAHFISSHIARFFSTAVKKGKDVDLYSASHVQDTSNVHLRHWNWAARPLFRSPHSLQTQPAARSDPTTGLRQRQPAVGLHLRNPWLMDYYSFNRPQRDGWLSWPCWLTDSGRFTHKVVTRPAISLAQDRESSPARTGSLTTMLRHQLYRDTGAVTINQVIQQASTGCRF